MPRFTHRQGQFLAYIHLYRKLHGISPSETEMGRHFQVTPPSVHQMILKLEREGLITREPGVARSLRLAIPASELPELDDKQDAPETSEPTPRPKSAVDDGTRLYTLKVSLTAGPVSEKFANREISRTIQIRGDQTLADLHRAIFTAFDRWEEHLYEFQFGKRPMDPKGPRYTLGDAIEDDRTGDVEATTIESLKLKVGRAFAYWFDFGDDWWHQIDVEKIEPAPGKGKFPRVAKRVGKSPPQYADGE